MNFNEIMEIEPRDEFIQVSSKLKKLVLQIFDNTIVFCTNKIYSNRRFLRASRLVY